MINPIIITAHMSVRELDFLSITTGQIAQIMKDLDVYATIAIMNLRPKKAI